MPSAAILAGGQARRFGGRDKSALPIGGRSILARQIDVLSEISDDVVVVGRVVNHPGGSIRSVPDCVAGLGPLGGLDAALASARHNLLLVVACDMPFIRVEFLDYLLSRAGAEGLGAVDAVVPRTARGHHPLCAVYSRACATPVRAQLAAHDLAMSALLARLRVDFVEEREIERFGPSDRLLANVNTPEELLGLSSLAAAAGHKS